ncbi:MAG: hypothetical protein COV59_03955 [Candidatus Magasanikbacteria bacterium CG11_big_fil_rev_8_21_14_0_20_39_34]|uniref:YibE/F family protein n=1 Tax=Candidatus Magasanikbacteria bacterium CG11_big_fil_rev_8_21_14_0_20_39_34 TaxID=1974653 RepID=A0A2H0N4H0_9BACT|nr:MAG: hypothetical protein COV59_03955 [Candidatus Magasanikbacteria bacterium CG11_big_fil_rev_8_21_14_0_20_39_34]
MKKFIIYAVLSLFLFPGIVFTSQEEVTTSTVVLGNGPDVSTPIADVFFKAKVVEVQKGEIKEEFGTKSFFQNVKVELIDGDLKGKQLNLLYESRSNAEDQLGLKMGEKVVVGRSLNEFDTQETYYIADVYRLHALLWFFLFFIFVALIFAGKHGMHAFIGLGLSFFVIMYFIVPKIISGSNPFLISFVGTMAIACFSIYVAHGIKPRTHIAFFSTIVTIFISLLLAYIAVHSMRLFGLGSEEAFYLRFSPKGEINLQGLLLGGIIIGTLGILDDITTAQAASVDEIHKANSSLSFGELYKRGLSVGKEHIISLVNTLVLAYTGASFPLLLLFNIYQQPIWLTLNSEILIEEIARMLVGSISLIFAVPITTALAAYVFSRKKT